MQSTEFSRPEYWSGQPFPSPGDLPNRGIEPRSPTLQADSLPAEPQGKPKNTGVGSLSPFQGIFPTQELNQGLLHCLQIILPTELSGKPLKIFEVYSVRVPSSGGKVPHSLFLILFLCSLCRKLVCLYIIPWR